MHRLVLVPSSLRRNRAFKIKNLSPGAPGGMLSSMKNGTIFDESVAAGCVRCWWWALGICAVPEGYGVGRQPIRTVPSFRETASITAFSLQKSHTSHTAVCIYDRRQPLTALSSAAVAVVVGQQRTSPRMICMCSHAFTISASVYVLCLLVWLFVWVVAEQSSTQRSNETVDELSSGSTTRQTQPPDPGPLQTPTRTMQAPQGCCATGYCCCSAALLG